MRGIPPSLAEELDGRPESVYGDEDSWSSKFFYLHKFCRNRSDFGLYSLIEETSIFNNF